MARFESPCQIVSLFLTAGVVAVILILLINAEVKHREQKETSVDTDDGAGITVTAGLRGVARKVMQMFSESPSSDEQQNHNRRKREADDKYLSTNTEDMTTSMMSSEALLTSAATGHKVRNIRRKIQDIGKNSQLVETVLELYCGNRESVNFILCYNSSQVTNSTEDEAKNVDQQQDYHKNLTDYVT